MARSNELGAGDSDAGQEEAGGGEGMRESRSFPLGTADTKGGRSALQVDSGQGQGTFDHGVKEADCWNSLLDL